MTKTKKVPDSFAKQYRAEGQTEDYILEAWNNFKRTNPAFVKFFK